MNLASDKKPFFASLGMPDSFYRTLDINRRVIKLSLALYVLWFCVGSGILASEKSPFAKVGPLPLNEVRWTDGFFYERFELCRTQMIPSMARLMSGTNYTHFLRNFEIIASVNEGTFGTTNGGANASATLRNAQPNLAGMASVAAQANSLRVRGASFNDGDFYKFLEAASATLFVTNNSVLAKELDDMIAIIARAQLTNGYVDTWVQWHSRDTNSKVAPFSSRANWEVYNLGQLFTAASVHYHATGKTNFLNIARKAADHLDEVFRTPTPELALHNVCPAHYMGLMDLYRATGEPRYLELGKKFLAMRTLVKDGGSDNQDRIPFAQQTEAEGHAVRANYLYAGAVDVFLESGDDSLWRPLLPIWTNMIAKKMYLTGGCGALFDGAAPDGDKDQGRITRVHQAYGRNFQLPNTTAHNETCASIGNIFWNWRMFLATGESKFVDVLETALYNAVPAGVALDGTNFFYTNPLRVTEPMPVDLRWPRTRVPFVTSFCCPPNLLRTIAESAGYAYAKSDETIWVNLYGSSLLATKLGGENLKLSQETEYPWSGRVRIKILECGTKAFALKLRIPSWVNDYSVRLNQEPKPVAPKVAAPNFIEIRRVWQVGDVVELDLSMPVRKLEANPLVEETLDQVAFQRGPIVYCLESPDLPSGVKLSQIKIPGDLELRARFDSRLLGGVVVLDGKVLTRGGEPWGAQLYRDLQPERLQTNSVKFIPYAVWQNRGPSEMSVWLPR